MSDTLTIQSHKGPYSVHFGVGPLGDPSRFTEAGHHAIVDANVARLYAEPLAPLLARPTTVVMEATEEQKSLEALVPLFHRLVADGVRRDHRLVAIGGGIVQDATCFVASTLLRGVPWTFVPTTLLAQADSCIGSKSSINLGGRKNLLGTFYPPVEVQLQSEFLDTLDPKEIRSGIGEIVKVHAIAGREAFDGLAAEFDALFTDRAVLARFTRAALEVKKGYIERDEFDQGVRNIFNYGHSFGHAIEAATHYAIPHGIAVAMGMDAANALAAARGLAPASEHARMHPVMQRLYGEFSSTPIDVEAVLTAMASDKKNTSTALGLILPVGSEARIERTLIERDETLLEQLRTVIGAVFR